MLNLMRQRQKTVVYKEVSINDTIAKNALTFSPNHLNIHV